MIKYFRFDWNFALWEIGYSNLLMLLATIPTYKEKGEEEKEVETIDFGGDMQKLANFINNQR